MGLVQMLKKMPIDLGQAEMKESTKGKLIAFSYVPTLENAKALDIGCRDGYWSKKLMEKGYSVDSLDVEPHYEKAIKFDANNTLPYSENTFDVVWCSEVIEHLKDPKKSILDMLRVVKPGGKVFLTTPNSYFLLIRLVYLILNKSPKDIQNAGHLHFFNLDKLKEVIPENSKIYGYFPYCIFKMEIKQFLNMLTPTFVVIIEKEK